VPDQGQPAQPNQQLADNLTRLMGLHGLSSNFAADLLGVTPASLSAWLNSRATPSLNKAVAIAELFGISTDRLLQAPFVSLLENELADPTRYTQVEETIQRARAAQRTP
jgi:transcriptional regulator with XRE-family HTH domain